MRIGFKISPKRFIFRGAFVRMIEFLSFSVRWTSYRRIIPIFNSHKHVFMESCKKEHNETPATVVLEMQTEGIVCASQRDYN